MNMNMVNEYLIKLLFPWNTSNYWKQILWDLKSEILNLVGHLGETTSFSSPMEFLKIDKFWIYVDTLVVLLKDFLKLSFPEAYEDFLHLETYVNSTLI